MSSPNLRDLADEKLVFIIRRRPPHPRRMEAGAVLEERYRRLLCGRIRRAIPNVGRFLSAVKCGCLEHFAADVLGKAIRTYRRGRGTRFSTWLYGLLTHEIVSGERLRRPPLQAGGRDGRGLLEGLEERPRPGAGLEALVLSEGVELARSCLRAMDGRRRRVFVWSFLLGMTNGEIREIWPHESDDNIKQIKCRSAARFLALWERGGGGALQEMHQVLAGPMAERIEPDRIRDARARRAYRLWMQKGSLSAAARGMGMPVSRLRRLVLRGLEEILGQVFRGGRERDREGEETPRPFLSRAERTIDFVRAAFGFAPPGAGAGTLGGLLLERLRAPEDFDRACRELRLGPAGLRDLLADERVPDRSLFGRLSRFLGIPAARLRALPRRAGEEAALPLRSCPGFDAERFRERVMEWIEGKKR